MLLAKCTFLFLSSRKYLKLKSKGKVFFKLFKAKQLKINVKNTKIKSRKLKWIF